MRVSRPLPYPSTKIHPKRGSSFVFLGEIDGGFPVESYPDGWDQHPGQAHGLTRLMEIILWNLLQPGCEEGSLNPPSRFEKHAKRVANGGKILAVG